MFYPKAPPAVSGGAALIRGRRFHLERVLYGYAQLIDALAGRFGRGKSALFSHRDDLRGPFAWPDPGKENALRVWRGLAANFDAVGEGVTHVIPALPMTAKAYVLGRQWAVYDPRSAGCYTSQRKDVSTLDTAPVVEIYGRDLPGGGRVGLGQAATDALQRLVVRDLARYGFIFTLLSVEDGRNGHHVLATVRFSDTVYGAGEDWIRVRCVAPDGSELGRIGFAN